MFDYPESVHPIRSYQYHSQSYIFEIAIADQALLHAILALSRIHTLCFGTNSGLNHVEKIRFVEGDPEILYHHLRAMNQVNKKLEIGDVSDTTIATVLILLLHHVSFHCLQDDNSRDLNTDRENSHGSRERKKGIYTSPGLNRL